MYVIQIRNEFREKMLKDQNQNKVALLKYDKLIVSNFRRSPTSDKNNKPVLNVAP